MGGFPVPISLGMTHNLAIASGQDLAGHVFAAVEDKGRLSLLLRNEGPASLSVRSLEGGDQAELILQMSYQDAPFVLATGTNGDMERLYQSISRKILRGIRGRSGPLRNPLQSFVVFLGGGLAALAFTLFFYIFSLAPLLSGQPSSLASAKNEPRSEAQLAQSRGQQAANGSSVAGENSLFARAERIRDDILRGEQISEARLATLPESVQAAARAAIALRDAQRAAALSSPPSGRPSPTGTPSAPMPMAAAEPSNPLAPTGADGAVVFIPTDRHGVATIPNSGSPLYRVPRPRLPMPGGGDITAPEHLQVFGLSPY